MTFGFDSSVGKSNKVKTKKIWLKQFCYLKASDGKKKKAKSDVYTRNNCSQFSYYEKWDPEQKMRHSGKTGLFI